MTDWVSATDVILEMLRRHGVAGGIGKIIEYYDRIDQDDILTISGVRDAIRNGNKINIANKTKNESYTLTYSMDARQLEMILRGSLINVVRGKSTR